MDGKPASFQLSRPWSNTINPKTGQSEDQPNLLIILPLAGPLDRNDVINEAVSALKTAPLSGWNISILDDSGNQTAYTRQIPLVITELEKIGAENPPPTDLVAWRNTACAAIASMRDLPGRRVVLSLGDLFHELVYQGYSLVYQEFRSARCVHRRPAPPASSSTPQKAREEIELLRRLPAPYSVLGSGPWMFVSDHDLLAGWISDTVADTLQQIRKDGMAAYDLDLYLDLKQMDGLPHTVSITPRRQQIIVDAPLFYVAPNLAQLQELSTEEPPPCGRRSKLRLQTLPRRSKSVRRWNTFPIPTAELERKLLALDCFGRPLLHPLLSWRWPSSWSKPLPD